MTTIRQRALSAWTIPDRRPIYEWAAEHVTLSGAFTVQGHFNVQLSRYLIDPFDALQDDLVREVVVVAPVRSGKSMISDVWLPWIVCVDPGPTMVTMQSDPIAKRHAETRTMPMLQMCPPVAAHLPIDRHKIRTQEVIFSHGMPLYVQGPSLGNLQSVGIRYMVADELWMWEPGRFVQAVARLGDFEKIGMSKLLVVSQAGVKDDDLDQEWHKGDCREWEVQCLHCGAYMPAVFSGRRQDGSRWGMRWDEADGSRDKLGNWVLSRVIPTVRWECRECGKEHLDTQHTRAEWNRTGRYGAPTNARAQSGVRSFHWSAVVTRSWDSLVSEFLQAQNAMRIGVLDQLRAFTQKRDAVPWSEDYGMRDEKVRAVEMASDWKDEKARVLTIDRQADGLHWATVRAWSARGESRRMWFGRLYSEDEIVAKAAEYKVPPNRTLIDSGFDSKLVYGMCVRHGWIALKGDDKPHFPNLQTVNGVKTTVLRSYSQPIQADPEIGTVHGGRRFALLIRWSNPTIKDRLQRLIDLGLWTEPPAADNDEMDVEYRRQMRGQWKRPIRDPKTGRTRWMWCDNGNDHARDCACMQVLAATLLKILPDVEPETSEQPSQDSETS